MKVIIRNYFSNIELGLDIASNARKIKKGRCIKEIIEFVDDDIIMTEVDEFNNVIEQYNIDEFDATEAIQDAEDSCFCTIEYIK